MSLPDYLLDPPDDAMCEECGEHPIWHKSRALCIDCWHDLHDVMDDEAIEESLRTIRGAHG